MGTPKPALQRAQTKIVTGEPLTSDEEDAILGDIDDL